MNHTYEGYWDTKTTAGVVGVNIRTLHQLRLKGLIPAIRLTSKLIRFEPAKVREAMSKLSTGAGI
jgi:hypothetical protein